jgi:hypothetical protein
MKCVTSQSLGPAFLPRGPRPFVDRGGDQMTPLQVHVNSATEFASSLHRTSGDPLPRECILPLAAILGFPSPGPQPSKVVAQ